MIWSTYSNCEKAVDLTHVMQGTKSRSAEIAGKSRARGKWSLRKRKTGFWTYRNLGIKQCKALGPVSVDKISDLDSFKFLCARPPRLRGAFAHGSYNIWEKWSCVLALSIFKICLLCIKCCKMCTNQDKWKYWEHHANRSSDSWISQNSSNNGGIKPEMKLGAVILLHLIIAVQDTLDEAKSDMETSHY